MVLEKTSVTGKFTDCESANDWRRTHRNRKTVEDYENAFIQNVAEEEQGVETKFDQTVEIVHVEKVDYCDEFLS